MGNAAGQSNQGSYAIAVGTSAGSSNQGSYAIAVGTSAGRTSQGSSAVAVGTSAGNINQDPYAVAVGTSAGYSNQGSYAVAVGYEAGQTSQGSYAVAVGVQAGYSNQEFAAIAVGDGAGETSQGSYAIAVGQYAGYTSQGTRGIAVGYLAGRTSQGTYATAVGHAAGYTSQGTRGIAVGNAAGRNNQGCYAVAVGENAGYTSQGVLAVAVGNAAGLTSQGSYAIAVGSLAGWTSQGSRAIALGNQAGRTLQTSHAIALGNQAGRTSQGKEAIAVGTSAGYTKQGLYAITVGTSAGYTSQGNYATAVGYQAGYNDQGSRGVAVGYAAGLTSQGEYAVAVGDQAGMTNQLRYSIVLNASGSILNGNSSNAFFVKKLRNTGGTAMYYDTSSGEISYSTSDDRMKVKEVRIKDATTTLMKLSPQNYFKKFKLEEPNISHYESGLMAQDVWYDAPELRHVVHLGAYADPTLEKPPAPSDSLEDDPDYSAWGSDPAQVQYDQLIPYTIKSIKEIVTELPRSKTTVSNTWGQNISGLVVSANTNTHKTNTTPIVALSNVYMDKKWYGVVSDKTTDTNDYDTLVDTKGDTRIWVTDVNGSLESGDLLTTSNVAPGYTQRQDDDLIRNSTVAKVTQDCDFTEPIQHAIKVPRKELSNVTYYIEKTEVVVDLYDYEQNLSEKRKTIKTKTVYRKIHTEGTDTTYFDADGNEVSKRKYETLVGGSVVTYTDVSTDKYNELTSEEQGEYTETVKNVYYRIDFIETPIEIEAYDETEIRQEMVDVLDENGQIVWEDTANMVPVYTLVDHGTYKAALVSCKLI